MNLGRQRHGPRMATDVAVNILAGDPTSLRSEARDYYLRTLPEEELFEWFEKTIRALLLRHPKHGALIVEMAEAAGKEFGVSADQVAIVRDA